MPERINRILIACTAFDNRGGIARPIVNQHVSVNDRFTDIMIGHQSVVPEKSQITRRIGGFVNTIQLTGLANINSTANIALNTRLGTYYSFEKGDRKANAFSLLFSILRTLHKKSANLNPFIVADTDIRYGRAAIAMTDIKTMPRAICTDTVSKHMSYGRARASGQQNHKDQR